MRYSPLAFIVALVAAGCAASTGILPAGPDTYTVTERFAPVRGGSTTAQQTAVTEANAFRAQQGRQFLPVDMFTPASANPYGTTGYSVTFRCLLSGDPELAAVRPGLVYVSLCAFSHKGPWASRRGFDTVVQNISGITTRQGELFPGPEPGP